ncbi:hypothetical protein Y032_0968g3241, partial [Ancylostoma ceylanicum]
RIISRLLIQRKRSHRLEWTSLVTIVDDVFEEENAAHAWQDQGKRKNSRSEVETFPCQGATTISFYVGREPLPGSARTRSSSWPAYAR